MIVLTGDIRPETRARALALGAAAYLVKPRGVDELCRVLADLLAGGGKGEASGS